MTTQKQIELLRGLAVLLAIFSMLVELFRPHAGVSTSLLAIAFIISIVASILADRARASGQAPKSP